MTEYVYIYIVIYILRLPLKKSMYQASQGVSVSPVSFTSRMQNVLHRRTDSAKLPGVKLFEPVPLPCEAVPCEAVPCEPRPCEPVPRGVVGFLSRSPKRTSKVGCLCHASVHEPQRDVKQKLQHNLKININYPCVLYCLTILNTIKRYKTIWIPHFVPVAKPIFAIWKASELLTPNAPTVFCCAERVKG